jgi:hypothetical protein
VNGAVPCLEIPGTRFIDGYALARYEQVHAALTN